MLCAVLGVLLAVLAVRVFTVAGALRPELAEEVTPQELEFALALTHAERAGRVFKGTLGAAPADPMSNDFQSAVLTAGQLLHAKGYETVFFVTPQGRVVASGPPRDPRFHPLRDGT